ncbi:hypothetical protein [Ralstonia phage RP13]|nr:hypothetical protein [Ralstonia phage RP13]
MELSDLVEAMGAPARSIPSMDKSYFIVVEKATEQDLVREARRKFADGYKPTTGNVYYNPFIGKYQCSMILSNSKTL